MRPGVRLPRSFYARPTLEVARDLLGKTLVHDSPDGRRMVRLVEVEAYLGLRDPASHAYRGMTPRSAPMFGRAGHSYVYLVYGMYWCANVVSEWPGSPGAVLLRGAEPLDGVVSDARLLAGPGKLARSLGLTGSHTGLDLVRGSPLSIHDAPAVRPHEMVRSPRIGLNPGPTFDKPWRFTVRGSLGVSRP
ncbi:MAG: DNA-3-methyladenine glycosylase [Chloroflexota bacterium]|nr:DNA-3-methyladenine glycosylase [Chloroflexota bacterium]